MGLERGITIAAALTMWFDRGSASGWDGSLFALRFADGLQDANLRHSREVVVDRRCPSGLDHIKADRAGDLIRMGKARMRLFHGSITALSDRLAQWAKSTCRLTSNVLLAEHQFVEGNITRWAERDLLNGLYHVVSP